MPPLLSRFNYGTFVWFHWQRTFWFLAIVTTCDHADITLKPSKTASQRTWRLRSWFNNFRSLGIKAELLAACCFSQQDRLGLQEEGGLRWWCRRRKLTDTSTLMASNYLLMIVVPVPAWQPQLPIKHLLELEAGLLIGKTQIQSRLKFLPSHIYQSSHAFLHCLLFPPPWKEKDKPAKLWKWREEMQPHNKDCIPRVTFCWPKA